ncbi:glyoxalase/bleomycin resistance/extradiol dioxygenase family protein [Acuticoccus sp. I52.16.1]|uniref:VOC family protein n=1 Tax=Acuticoccus sp. I52.16.1 TaxID=2928472 RepID=UPI001FCFB5FF|nr:VOC family protein [Acuticoccus sp. I52.16.1]UOM35542.1 VOC family protein [Acuticoccus sp. I52.16.1]
MTEPPGTGLSRTGLSGTGSPGTEPNVGRAAGPGTAAFKPDGYTSVAPYLIVADAEATLSFLERALGARRRRIFEREDGSVMHAEVLVDDTVVMLGEMPESQPAHVHVYVADVDAAFARALAAGGTSAQPPAEKGDGDRRGGVVDPNGITWWLSTQLAPDA